MRGVKSLCDITEGCSLKVIRRQMEKWSSSSDLPFGYHCIYSACACVCVCVLPRYFRGTKSDISEVMSELEASEGSSVAAGKEGKVSLSVFSLHRSTSRASPVSSEALSQL